MPRKKNICLVDEDEDSDKCDKKYEGFADNDDNLDITKVKKTNIKKVVSFRLNNDDFSVSTNTDLPIKQSKELLYKKNSKSTLNKPWIEKYRPTNVEELVLEPGTLNKIKKIIDDKNMPNIIITGLPGIGKTTTILCIAKNLLGKYFNQGVLELNASDDRGVKTVQESIEYFCKKKLVLDGDNYAKHKIVLLDEADNMTIKAQQAINNLIKQYQNTTRFAFTCNESSDIIEAIQSRCIILRYARLDNKHIAERLKKICHEEKIKYTDEGIDAIVLTAQGDLRKAINNIQLTFNGYCKIIPENVHKLCDTPHPFTLQNIFEACYKKDIKTALSLLNELRGKGYSSSDISFSMINILKNFKFETFDEATKIKYMDEISRTCLVISKGLNTSLQLTGAISHLCR